MRLILYGLSLILCCILIESIEAQTKNYKNKKDIESSSGERHTKYEDQKKQKSYKYKSNDGKGQKINKYDIDQCRGKYCDKSIEDVAAVKESKYKKYTKKIQTSSEDIKELPSFKIEKKSKAKREEINKEVDSTDEEDIEEGLTSTEEDVHILPKVHRSNSRHKNIKKYRVVKSIKVDNDAGTNSIEESNTDDDVYISPRGRTKVDNVEEKQDSEEGDSNSEEDLQKNYKMKKYKNKDYRGNVYNRRVDRSRKDIDSASEEEDTEEDDSSSEEVDVSPKREPINANTKLRGDNSRKGDYSLGKSDKNINKNKSQKYNEKEVPKSRDSKSGLKHKHNPRDEISKGGSDEVEEEESTLNHKHILQGKNHKGDSEDVRKRGKAAKTKVTQEIVSPEDDSIDDVSDETEELEKTCKKKSNGNNRGKDNCDADVDEGDETNNEVGYKQKIKYSIKFAHEKQKSSSTPDDTIIKKIHKDAKKYKYDDDDDNSSEEHDHPKRFHYIDDDDDD